MSALIERLFEDSQSEAIKSLLKDEGSQLLVHQEIGKKLLDTDELVSELPLAQLMLITSLSPFAHSEDECCNVASILYWGIDKTDILPVLTDQYKDPKELGYRCFIALGLFRNRLQARTDRYGAPSPSFYRAVGKGSLKQIGFVYVSQNFDKWENFLSEMFPVNGSS